MDIELINQIGIDIWGSYREKWIRMWIKKTQVMKRPVAVVDQ